MFTEITMVYFAEHLDTLLRALVLNRLGLFCDEDVIKESKKRFEGHVSGKTIIPADLRSAVYKAVLVVGNEETFDKMLRVSIPFELFQLNCAIST